MKKPGILLLISLLFLSASAQKLKSTAQALQKKFEKHFYENIVLPADKFDKERLFSREVNNQAEAIFKVTNIFEQAISDWNPENLEAISGLVLQRGVFGYPDEDPEETNVRRTKFAFDLLLLFKGFEDNFYVRKIETKQNTSGETTTTTKSLYREYEEGSKDQRINYILERLITLQCDWVKLIEEYEQDSENISYSNWEPKLSDKLTFELIERDKQKFEDHIVLPLSDKLRGFKLGQFADYIDQQSKYLTMTAYNFYKILIEIKRDLNEDKPIKKKNEEEIDLLTSKIIEIGHYKSDILKQMYGLNDNEVVETSILHIIKSFSTHILLDRTPIGKGSGWNRLHYIQEELMKIDCDWKMVIRNYIKAKKAK